jgi:hypothetical protein
MKKVMGFALAVLVAVPVAAAAGELKGTVKAIDRADQTIVLDDGTKLTVTERELATITPGDQVKAMYETRGGQNVVSDFSVRGIGSEARSTTNWGPSYGTELDSSQAE